MARLKQWSVWARQAKYKVGKFASLAGYSLSELEDACNEQFGMSPRAWLNEQQFAETLALLAWGLAPKVVFSLVGIRHLPNFYRKFQAQCGCAPTDYARALRSHYHLAPPCPLLVGGNHGACPLRRDLGKTADPAQLPPPVTPPQNG